MNLVVFGTKAGAMLKPFEVYSEMDGELVDLEFPNMEETDILLKNTIAFLDACDGKPSNICDARQGAVLQKIVEAIYKNAER